MNTIEQLSKYDIGVKIVVFNDIPNAPYEIIIYSNEFEIIE